MINFRKHVRELTETMTTHSAGMLPNFAVDVVHKFRTTYKKLRAVVGYTESILINPPRMKPALNKYYALLGKLRSIQILCNRINQVPSLARSEIPEILSEHENKIMRKLEKKSFRHVLSCWSEKNQSRFPRTISEHAMGLYFRQLFSRIGSIVFKQYVSDDDLHMIRKLLKDIYYLAIACGVWQKGIPNYFAEMMNDLGAFHDVVVQKAMLAQLAPLIRDDKTAGELRKYLQLLQLEMDQRRELLLREIVAVFGQTQSAPRLASANIDEASQILPAEVFLYFLK